MVIELSDEQLHLCVQGLQTAAIISQDRGHNEQARKFGRLWSKLKYGELAQKKRPQSSGSHTSSGCVRKAN